MSKNEMIRKFYTEITIGNLEWIFENYNDEKVKERLIDHFFTRLSGIGGM